jgi:hypothetical protein
MGRFSKILVSLLLALTAQGVAYADKAPTILVDELAPGILQLFKDGLVKPQMSVESPDAEGIEMWEAASAAASTELQTFVNFEAEGRPSYSVMLQFGAKSVTVRHSNPAYGTGKGGLRLRFDSNPYRSFLEGQEFTGVVVAVSSFHSSSFKGIALCPRDRPSNGGRGTLAATGHKFSKVTFIPNASISGNFRTGLVMGRARAEILTSANIKPSIQPIDEVFSKDPTIENRYKPDGRIDDGSLPKDLLSGGILSQVTLTKDSGDLIRVRSRRIVRVDKIEVPQLLVSAWNSQYKVDAGECVLVSEERDERSLNK